MINDGDWNSYGNDFDDNGVLRRENGDGNIYDDNEGYDIIENANDDDDDDTDNDDDDSHTDNNDDSYVDNDTDGKDRGNKNSKECWHR